MKTSRKPNKQNTFMRRAVAALLSVLMLVALFPEVTMAEGAPSDPVVIDFATEPQEPAKEATPAPTALLPEGEPAEETPTPASSTDVAEETPTPTPTPTSSEGGGGILGSLSRGMMLMAVSDSSAECALSIRFSGVSISGGDRKSVV